MTEQDPKHYPVLRNLQFSPFKEKDEQYVVLWDPSGVTKERLVVPMNYFYVLQFFDGEHSLEEVGARYLQQFGELLMPAKLERLVEELERKLFLEGPAFEAAKQAAIETYRALPLRKAAYAGRAYEADPGKLRKQLEECFVSKEGPGKTPSANRGKALKARVVPHYELGLAGPVYAWAYK